METELARKLDAAWGVLSSRTRHTPRIAVVLGSGLGEFASRVRGDDVPFNVLPGFPVPTVAGHSGKFIVGDRTVVVAGRVHYYEGHPMQDVVLPVNLGEDKMGAKPVINNIALTNDGGSYQMTGDVTNAGITDAQAMVLSVDDPVHPVEPYPNYAIGSLASDDFSSFTLTFTGSDLSSVPVKIQWKDAQGNSFTTTSTVDLRTLASASFSGTRSSASGSSSGAINGGGGFTAGGGAARGGGGGFSLFGGSGRGGGLAAFYPVIAGGIILVIGIVLYTKRKWVLTKLKKQ